jgi:hypothetical protein
VATLDKPPTTPGPESPAEGCNPVCPPTWAGSSGPDASETAAAAPSSPVVRSTAPDVTTPLTEIAVAIAACPEGALEADADKFGTEGALAATSVSLGSLDADRLAVEAAVSDAAAESLDALALVAALAFADGTGSSRF